MTITTLIEKIEELTKEAVQRVFQTMLSMDVSADGEWPPDGIDVEIISAVGFIGMATGSVYVCADGVLARTIAARMLGLAENEVADDMVSDVMGEVSNMIVGQVKSHLCDHGRSCTLTIPSIVRGQCLSVERPANVSARIIAFRFKDRAFFTEILIKETDL